MTKQSYFLDNIKEISVEISGKNGQYYLSIYNDKTNKSVALNIGPYKLLGLADFINKYVEENK